MITVTKKKSKDQESLYSLEIKVRTIADHRALINSLDYAIEKKNKQVYLSTGGLIILNKFLRDVADSKENTVIELTAQKNQGTPKTSSRIKSGRSSSNRK